MEIRRHGAGVFPWVLGQIVSGVVRISFLGYAVVSGIECQCEPASGRHRAVAVSVVAVSLRPARTALLLRSRKAIQVVIRKVLRKTRTASRIRNARDIAVVRRARAERVSRLGGGDIDRSSTP